MKAPFNVVWHKSKAQANWRKHRISFRQAASVMLDPLAMTRFDAEHSEVEDRWFTLGQTSEGRLLAVSHTYQEMAGGRLWIRLISARPATRQEQQQYEGTPE